MLGWRAAYAAPPPFVSRWYNRWYWYLAYGFAAYAFLGAVAMPSIKAHVIEAFRVPSESMAPTVLAGDFLMIRTGSGGSRLDRDAIVICTSLEEPGLKLIKRIAGIAPL